MSENENDGAFESPHRIDTATWEALVAELGADAAPKRKRARSPSKVKAGGDPEFAQGGARSAWEVALELAGRLGRPLGDGRFAVWCINDHAHSSPERSAEAAQGSCVLLPPTKDSMFGLPKCSHAHCQGLTLRQWIAGVGFDTWAEAMLVARGWRRAREFLLHDGGISGWRKAPFLLRDHEDTVEGGPYQVLPDDGDEYAINFHARIVGDVKLHTMEGVRRWYDVDAVVGGRARSFRVAAADFNSMGWVANELGAEAIIQAGRDTAQKLRVGIQFLSTPVAQRDIYATTGWRKVGGEDVYLHAGGAVGAKGAIPDVAVQLHGDAPSRFALPAPLEGAALAKAVRACLALFRVGAPHVAVPLFGAVWRAALGPSPLTLYLSAPPATGKSLLAALAQQHFGAGLHEGALPASVKHSTAASVNALRAMIGDAVFTLDDFIVSGNAAEDLRLNEKVDTVVRAQYGGTGAQRLSRDGSLSTGAAPPPRSTLVITGETLPRGHSLRSRLLVLELPGRIDQDLSPMKVAAAKGVYAGAMAAFLRWMAPQLETLRAGLRDRVEASAARLRADTDDRDHRAAFLLAEVDVGVQLFCAWAAEVDEGLGGDLEHLRQLARVTLRGMVSTQLAHRAAQDPCQRFLELLAAALSGGRCHVALDDGTAPENATAWGWRVAGSTPNIENEEQEQVEAFDDHPAPAPPEPARSKRIVYRGMGDCVGVVHAGEGLVWIKPEVAMGAVRALASSSGDPLALTTEDLPRRLYEKGFLAKTDLKNARAYTVKGPKETGFARGYLCLKTATLLSGGEPADGTAASTDSTGSGNAVRENVT